MQEAVIPFLFTTSLSLPMTSIVQHEHNGTIADGKTERLFRSGWSMTSVSEDRYNHLSSSVCDFHLGFCFQSRMLRLSISYQTRVSRSFELSFIFSPLLFTHISNWRGGKIQVDGEEIRDNFSFNIFFFSSQWKFTSNNSTKAHQLHPVFLPNYFLECSRFRPIETLSLPLTSSALSVRMADFCVVPLLLWQTEGSVHST